MPRTQHHTTAQGDRIEVNVYGPEDADDDGVLHVAVLGVTVTLDPRATTRTRTAPVRPSPTRSEGI